ncbi:hypothetical protein HKX48_001083 [Thoreauomyces humboldtii]|nr:hypothetical protein HKX48_001083 [Thoreauomyces humboldtii]
MASPTPTSTTTTCRVLILGDGNFSFSAALCRILWPSASPDATLPSIITPQNVQNAHAYLGVLAPVTVKLTTTSFDDRVELLKKYPETRDILELLEGDRLKKEFGVEVLHGINAWELKSTFGDREPFDVIIWNHPHLGTEDFRLHRFLMAHFFESVASVLSTSPFACVCVSLVQGQETRWDIVAQAQRSNLGLSQVARFDETLWPGYQVKRNKHGGSFKNLHTRKHTGSEMNSHLFRFARGEPRVSWEGMAATPIDRTLGEVVLANPLSVPTNIIRKGDRIAKENRDPQPGPLVMATATSWSPAAIKPSRSSAKSRRLAAVPADLVCPHCLKQLDSSRGYTQHVHMVHTLQKFGESWTPSRPLSFACSDPTCTRKFASETDAWQHAINRHSTVTASELPGAVDQLTDPSSGEANLDGGDQGGTDYDYVPCTTCGQAVVRREWGMRLHLETLKPAVGMDMRCPICVKEEGTGGKGFIESRALVQHYRFCSARRKGVVPPAS